MTYKKKTSYSGKRRKKARPWTRLAAWFSHLTSRAAPAPPIGLAGVQPQQRRRLVSPARLRGAFVCMMLGLVIWAGYQFASHWTIFRVSEISLSGARTLTERQVLALADLPASPQALSNITLDTGLIAERIAAHPRVASVRVKKRWPSGLAVEVREYEPFALVNFAAEGEAAGGLWHIDRTGHVIGEAPEGGELDFPVISGLDAADVADGRLGERAQGALQVLRLAARGNAILPMQSVSEVRVGEGGEIVLFLADHPFPINFGTDRLQAKFNDLLGVLKRLYDSGEIGQVASLEMGYGDNRNKMLCRWTQPR